MKKLLATIAAVLISAATYGQGQVQFENFTITGANILMPDGTTGVGPEGRVQLFLSNGTALGAPVAFDSTSPGQFFAGIITIPGVPSGAQQSFIVRAWIGESFETAALFGESNPTAAVTVGGGLTIPPTVPFQSFALVPEPSTMVLGLLGAVALLFRRRK